MKSGAVMGRSNCRGTAVGAENCTDAGASHDEDDSRRGEGGAG